MAIVCCAVRKSVLMEEVVTAKNDLSGDRTTTALDVGPVSVRFSSGQFRAVGIRQEARVSMSLGRTLVVVMTVVHVAMEPV